MKLTQLMEAMEQIAPTRHAESWDNVGLLAGDPEQTISRAMLTIDYTPEVACEAAGKKCDAIIAYHPPIFDAVKRITANGPGAIIFDAIKRGVAIYSPHTALDASDGGTNDVLADILELRERAPLKPSETKSTQYKLVTFAPKDAVEKIADALFAAGAGRIGNYSHCSFRSAGQGTFFGEPGSRPTIGSAGRLERDDEVRIETIAPIDKIDAIVRALRQSHPYETPAFDLIQIAPAPTGMGMGRVGKLPENVTADMLINRIKREIGVDHVLVAGDATRLVREAAVCAGACGNLLDDALRQNVDFYVTGEMRHHDALKAAARGMTVVCTLHSNSERITLKRVAAKLKEKLPTFPVELSSHDRDPFVIS